MDKQTTARQPLNTSRLLIDAAEKILDMQHGAGYAATHTDEVSEFLMVVGVSLWAKRAKQAELLAHPRKAAK